MLKGPDFPQINLLLPGHVTASTDVRLVIDLLLGRLKSPELFGRKVLRLHRVLLDILLIILFGE